MHTLSTAIVAIVLYVLGALRITASVSESKSRLLSPRAQSIGLLAAAAILHAAVLHMSVFSSEGLNLGIFNTASLAGWSIGLVILIAMLWRRMESLAVFVFPFIAAAIVLALMFPSTRILPADATLGLRIHVALSIIAYALFAIAAVQAIYLGIADYKLRHHRPSFEFLPPLPAMETTLFQLTGFAFVLLTLSLILGSLYVDSISAQHLAHKIVFSVIAWLVFAALIIGRWRFGWRGKRAIKFVLIGFACLALGFFGSKVVLELILHKV